MAGLIDLHHHLVFPEYVAAVEKLGIKDSGGAIFPKWTPQAAIEMMDRFNIAAAITSLSHPGVYFGDVDFAVELARRCNEKSAEIIQSHPNRFGGFATLPLPDVESSLAELEYALDTLKLDGIVLLSSYDNKYLGHPAFDELFAELNRRKTVVFVHPTIATSNKISHIAVPGWCLEFVFDTTRVATNLAATGTLKRYPDIRFIFSHGGGTVPYISWRIARGVSLAGGEYTHEEVLSLLQGLYYDTALTAPDTYHLLKEFIKPSKIVFGSDYSFISKAQVAFTIDALNNHEGFDENTRQAIFCQNALALFPRLQRPYCQTSGGAL